MTKTRIAVVALGLTAIYLLSSPSTPIVPIEPIPVGSIGTIDVDLPDWQVETLRTMLTTRKLEVAGWTIKLADTFTVKVSGTCLELQGSAIQVNGTVLKVPIKTAVTAIQYSPTKDAILVKLGTSLVDIRLK